MSAKTSPKRDALRDLLKDWFVANPNTPIDSKKLRELFGEDQQPANTVLGQVHNRVVDRASGRRNSGAPSTDELLSSLNISTNDAVAKGLVYRCAHATYVYDTEAFYRVGKAGGIKRNQFPIFHSSTLSEPARCQPGLPDHEEIVVEHPRADEQLQLPFPAPQPITPVPELATAIIESDRANRAALADTPPERRRLPILPVFPTPDDPKRAQLLARGDETIVIQTATEIITATIVVAVPR